MSIKAVRVFYRKSDNKIVWSRTLESIKEMGTFTTTIEQNLAEMPSNMPDGETPLGGVPGDYACIEEIDAQRAIALLDSDENEIVDGKLVVGAKRIMPEPIPARDLAKELDELKAEIKKLKEK